jgi:nitrate reductase NapE component
MSHYGLSPAGKQGVYNQRAETTDETVATMIRFLLLLVALVLSVALVAAHGVRGLVFLMILALAATLPQTRAWKIAERPLVRITGSRARAATLVMAVTITALVAVNLYQLVR